MKEITLKPIGIVHSPYESSKNIPIQGRFNDDVEAYVKLDKKYEKGLTDLEEFSHAIIVFYFHKADKITIMSKPYLENKEHGIFAIRSPSRPNPIGISVVKIKKIEGNKLYFTEVDVFDQTPVLDIKPYIKYFDIRENVKSGWLDKHFKNGNIPEQTILK